VWRLTAVWIHLTMALRRVPGNDRGYTAESVVLTMVLVGVGFAVGRVFDDEIVAAARSITFTDSD
jgi:hypothetical protein